MFKIQHEHLSRLVRKSAFCICENKDADQLCSNTAKLISAFVFAIWIVQFLYYLNLKFQASSHLLWLYSPVCVGPGRKPRRPDFSKRGSFNFIEAFGKLLKFEEDIFCEEKISLFFFQIRQSNIWPGSKFLSDHGFLTLSMCRS